MRAEELLKRYAAGERDFRRVNLERAKLRGANLSEADSVLNYVSDNITSRHERVFYITTTPPVIVIKDCISQVAVGKM